MKNYFILFFLIFLSSCSMTTIDYNMPVHRFDSPETKGYSEDFLTHFYTQFGTAAKNYNVSVLSAFQILGSVQVYEQSEVERRSGDLMLLFGLPVHKRVDIFWRDFTDTPGIIGVKYQFIGAGSAEKKKGFKAAASFGMRNSTEDEGSVDATDSNRKYFATFNGTLEQDIYDIGLLTGWRFGKHAMLYLNYFNTTYEVKAKLDSATYGNYSKNGTSVTNTFILGMRIDLEKVFWNLECLDSRGKWEKEKSVRLQSCGASIGVGI